MAETDPENTSDDATLNAYERQVRVFAGLREANLTRKLVTSGTEWQESRQGRTKTYSARFVTDIVPTGWRCFRKHIKVHSGKHRHQGGLVIFVVQGQGYTVVDGERVDWKEGDVLLLPLKPGGVEHQHFNVGEEPCEWVAFIYEPFAEVLGATLEQVEDSPDHKKKS